MSVYILLGFMAFVSCTRATQEAPATNVPSTNKTECVAQMVSWCKGMQYPQQGIGMTMLSITYEDPKGRYRVFCASDLDGTNCTRNGQPWFACVRVDDNNNTLTYKGQLLSAGADDEICATADKAFNELFVQNLSYDNTTMKTELEKGMESFFQQIAAMQEQIEQIQRRLMPLFSADDIWGEFFRRKTNGTDNEPSNQIEKE